MLDSLIHFLFLKFIVNLLNSFDWPVLNFYNFQPTSAGHLIGLISTFVFSSHLLKLVLLIQFEILWFSINFCILFRWSNFNFYIFQSSFKTYFIDSISIFSIFSHHTPLKKPTSVYHKPPKCTSHTLGSLYTFSLFYTAYRLIQQFMHPHHHCQ